MSFVLASIVQREMQIAGWFCNNSEIHLWLWKVWSLVVCSHSSFYVTGSRKDNKNRQNTLFVSWKKLNLVPNKQLLPNVLFQSTKLRTTKYKRLLEMCIVAHVESKSVFTFQPRNRLVSTTVKSASTSWIFLLRTEKWQLCCLAVMAHIVLQERRVSTTKKVNHLQFWRFFSANHN